MREKISDSAKRLSYFYQLLLANLSLGICCVAILALIFIPIVTSAARRSDRARTENMLYLVSAVFEELEQQAVNCQNDVQSGTWLHDVYINHVINGQPIAYKDRRSISSGLNILAARNRAVSTVTVQYYDESDAIYSAAGVLEHLSHYQELMPQSLEYRFFLLNGAQEGFCTILFEDTEYLYYRLRLSDVPGGRDKAEMNILFNTQVVGRMLSAAANDQAAAFRILNAEGTPVWQLGDPGKTACDTVTAVSDSGCFRFQADIPRAVSRQTARRVLPLAALAVVLDLAACAAFSFALSRRNCRPVRSVAERLVRDLPENQDLPAGENELISLSRSIDTVLREKTDTETALESLKPLAQQRILNQLLSGDAMLSRPSDEQLAYSGLSFRFPLYNVIAAHLPFLEGQTAPEIEELALRALLDAWAAQSGLGAYLRADGRNRFTVVVNYSQQLGLSACVERLYEACAAHFPDRASQMVFAAANPVRSSRELYRAAEQASLALNYAMLNRKGRIVSYEEAASQLSMDYFYPFSEELLFSGALTSGDAEQAATVLRKIIETNQAQFSHNPFACIWLYADLYSTMKRSVQSLGLSLPPDESPEHCKPATFSQVEQLALRQMERICARIRRCQDETKTGMDEQIFEYVEQALCDPNLSLGALADHFQKSSTYVSMLFKTRKHTNYTDYVNQRRIRRSVLLLTQTQMSMEEVYRAVGFSSLSTFRRNFTKYTNRNPGDFTAVPAFRADSRGTRERL